MLAMDAAASEWAKDGEKTEDGQFIYKQPKSGKVCTSKTLVRHWEKIAKAGINLDYHCYEPRSFVAPREQNHVDPDQMIWPGFVDENGTTWTMDDVYETYMKPYQDLADEAGVDFKVGESGMFLEGYDLFEESPRVENTLKRGLLILQTA